MWDVKPILHTIVYIGKNWPSISSEIEHGERTESLVHAISSCPFPVRSGFLLPGGRLSDRFQVQEFAYIVEHPVWPSAAGLRGPVVRIR